jgi:multiple sugar transport system ATP-binding protein
MAAIDLVGVTKSFGATLAVQDLTLAIDDKEFVALLGPSGCGKSTTMNVISGIERPTSGEIRFDGHDVRDVEARRRGVGFVFQNYAIFTHMTVRDNLAFGLKVRREPRQAAAVKVAAMAQLMRLADKLDHSAGRLNVNELQRLAIGRAAILRPEIFLLDEPLSNLDAAFRTRMRTELKLLQREIRQTMVYVTHDQLEAMSMADRIAVMNHGRLQQYGTPTEIYNRPANVFVASFMGSPSANLLPCRVAGSGEAIALDFGAGGSLPVDDPGLRARCRAAGDARLVLGIRPEHARLQPPGMGAAGIDMTVALVERVGARTIVYLEAADLKMTVTEANGYPAAPGMRMRLVIPPGDTMLFDARSGLRLADAETPLGTA